MEEHEGPSIEDRGRLKLPVNFSAYLELSPHEGDAALVSEPEEVLDFYDGVWQLWSTEELFRSFDKETGDAKEV